MSKNVLITTVALLLPLFSTEVGAQTLNPLNTHLQAVRIGLVDEFFDRFNGSAVHPDISARSDDSRKKNLMVLFNLAQFTSKEDSLFKEASDMMDTAIRDSVQIDFPDTTWAAIAHCRGKLDGNSVKFDLYLTVQHRKLDMYKWVIAKVDGDLFGIESSNDDERIMLNPDGHETNFISLRRVTTDQPHDIERFMSKSFDYDATSVFTYLVYNRKLKIDYVDDLEFIFTQIPGYIFHVSYFDRESSNSGWLISTFYKSSQENKDAFLSSLHSRTNHEALVADTNIQANNEITDDSAIVNNSIDFRDIFVTRTCEKAAQLNDYLNFLSSKRKMNSEMKRYLKERILSLFDYNTLTYLRYPDNTVECVNVQSFCDMLIYKWIVYESIDTISIPVWSDTINSLSPEVKKLSLPSVLYPIARLRREPYNPDGLPTSCSRPLSAYKENTELGPEWIPKLGDFIVNVKWSKRKKKNRNNH